MKDLLTSTIDKIKPLNKQDIHIASQLLSQVMSNAPGLGALRDMLLAYIGLRGTASPLRKYTVICCADHGIAKHGISAYPQETTYRMAANYLISHGAAANAFADFISSDLLVVDMGIATDTANLPGLLQRKIAYGTNDFLAAPAMTAGQTLAAINTGIEIAFSCCDNGGNCFLPGEMGIANTTSAAAMAAVLCHIDAKQATGRGTNISADRLKHKKSIVQQAIRLHQPNPADSLDVLTKLGGFEFACLTGLILGAAARQALVILDGFNTSIAALLAVGICPDAKHCLLSSQLSEEPAHKKVLQKLQLTPCLELGLSLSEGAGSALAADLLDAALKTYSSLTVKQPPSFDDTSFFHEKMPLEKPHLTDRTFDFYTHTMPPLSHRAMNACQSRLDHLAKPLYSLGALEQISVQLAGILNEDRPEPSLSKDILCFTQSELSPAQEIMTRTFAEHASAAVTIAHLTPDSTAESAFDFGRRTAEELSFSAPLLGLCLTESEASMTCGEKSRLIRQSLCQPDGNLLWPPKEFLNHLPLALQIDAAALMGAMIAGAHNSSLILLDDEATEIIAKYAELLCPEISSYILHIQPNLLSLGMSTGGGCIASLGLRLVTASLQMLNHMKTFSETKVAAANNGPGAYRQI